MIYGKTEKICVMSLKENGAPLIFGNKLYQNEQWNGL